MDQVRHLKRKENKTHTRVNLWHLKRIHAQMLPPTASEYMDEIVYVLITQIPFEKKIVSGLSSIENGVVNTSFKNKYHSISSKRNKGRESERESGRQKKTCKWELSTSDSQIKLHWLG